jgi:hypothetical protein
MPQGATGQCADGSYTKAKTQRGACSNHGGVKTWFGNGDERHGQADEHAGANDVACGCAD